MFSHKTVMQDKRRTGGVSKKKADIPLVGCLAYDTENLFTAGIDNSSEEIRKVTGIIGAAGIWVCLWVCVFEHKGVKRKKKKRRKKKEKTD